MGNDQTNDQVVKNEQKGRGLFYGVIAVATFIIMAVGATFAYFTATTHSGSGAVQTGSTTLQLKFISYGAGWMRRDLIPADTNVAEYSFENQNDTTLQDEDTMSNILCKDDYGNSVCSVYVFQIYNDANSPQTLSIDVLTESSGFTSLYAMAYELSLADTNQTAYDSVANNNHRFDPSFRKGVEGETGDNLIDVVDSFGTILDEGANPATQYSPIYVNRDGVTKTLLKVYNEEKTAKVPSVEIYLKNDADADKLSHVASDIEVLGGQTKTFAIVMYILNDPNRDQTADDAAKNFSGQVLVGNGDSSTGVSGSINAVLNGGDAGLQSNEQQGSGSGSGTSGGGPSGSNEP